MSSFVVTTILVGAAAFAGCSGASDLFSPTGATPTGQFGGPWRLVAQQPSDQPESVPPAGAVFGFEVIGGHAAVTADCNRCSGAAAVGDGTLTMGPALACTRAYCSSAPFDDTFVRLLADTNTASVDGNTLTLRSERGVLRFRRAD